jgi:hypothetical protein
MGNSDNFGRKMSGNRALVAKITFWQLGNRATFKIGRPTPSAPAGGAEYLPNYDRSVRGRSAGIPKDSDWRLYGCETGIFQIRVDAPSITCAQESVSNRKASPPGVRIRSRAKYAHYL